MTTDSARRLAMASDLAEVAANLYAEAGRWREESLRIECKQLALRIEKLSLSVLDTTRLDVAQAYLEAATIMHRKIQSMRHLLEALTGRKAQPRVFKWRGHWRFDTGTRVHPAESFAHAIEQCTQWAEQHQATAS